MVNYKTTIWAIIRTYINARHLPSSIALFGIIIGIDITIVQDPSQALALLFLSSNSILNRKSKMCLSLPTSIKIPTRSMMTAGTYITMYEKTALVKILHLHNVFLKRCLISLKVKNIALNDFIDFATTTAALNYKMFQNVISIMYPHIKFPLSMIRERITSLSIHHNDYISGTVDLDHFIAIIAGASVKNQPPLTNGSLYALGAPTQHRFLENSLAYQQTKQPNPDYQKITLSNSKERTVIWSRYYDLKTGKISVNRGHIYITSNDTIYEEKSQVLLQNQLKTYSSLCEADSPLVLYLYYLVNQNNKSWGDRNDLFKNFLLHHLKDAPDNINPSLIFKVNLDYNTENVKPSKILEGIVNRSSFEDVKTSRNTLTRVIYEVGGKDASEAYMHFNPFSPITVLIKAFITS